MVYLDLFLFSFLLFSFFIQKKKKKSLSPSFVPTHFLFFLFSFLSFQPFFVTFSKKSMVLDGEICKLFVVHKLLLLLLLVVRKSFFKWKRHGKDMEKIPGHDHQVEKPYQKPYQQVCFE